MDTTIIKETKGNASLEKSKQTNNRTKKRKAQDEPKISEDSEGDDDTETTDDEQSIGEPGEIFGEDYEEEEDYFENATSYYIDLQSSRNYSKNNIAYINLSQIYRFATPSSILPVDFSTATDKDWIRHANRPYILSKIVDKANGEVSLMDDEVQEVQKKKRSEQYDLGDEFQGWIESEETAVVSAPNLLGGFFCFNGDGPIPAPPSYEDDSKKGKGDDEKKTRAKTRRKTNNELPSDKSSNNGNTDPKTSQTEDNTDVDVSSDKKNSKKNKTANSKVKTEQSETNEIDNTTKKTKNTKKEKESTTKTKETVKSKTKDESMVDSVPSDSSTSSTNSIFSSDSDISNTNIDNTTVSLPFTPTQLQMNNYITLINMLDYTNIQVQLAVYQEFCVQNINVSNFAHFIHFSHLYQMINQINPNDPFTTTIGVFCDTICFLDYLSLITPPPTSIELTKEVETLMQFLKDTFNHAQIPSQNIDCFFSIIHFKIYSLRQYISLSSSDSVSIPSQSSQETLESIQNADTSSLTLPQPLPDTLPLPLTEEMSNECLRHITIIAKMFELNSTAKLLPKEHRDYMRLCVDSNLNVQDMCKAWNPHCNRRQFTFSKMKQIGRTKSEIKNNK